MISVDVLVAWEDGFTTEETLLMEPTSELMEDRFERGIAVEEGAFTEEELLDAVHEMVRIRVERGFTDPSDADVAAENVWLI